MKVSGLVVLISVLGCVACGSSGGGEASGEENGDGTTPKKEVTVPTKVSDPASKTPTSLALQASALPTCNADRESQLVWVIDEKLFKYCKAGKWEKTESTSNIKERWRYHVDGFQDKPDISEDTTSYTVGIGTVQLVKFGDGSGFVSLNGSFLNTDSADEYYQENFSYSFFLKASKSEQEFIMKFARYNDMRIRVKVALSDVPTFKATIDDDGNFGDNSEASFTLTKVE